MSKLSLLHAHGNYNGVFLVDGSPRRLNLTGAKLRLFVRTLCDRKGLFGADGMYFVDRSSAVARAWYFNSDGSSAEYCGNGLRCVGRLLLESTKQEEVEVLSGSARFRIQLLPPSPGGVHNVAVTSTSPLSFLSFDTPIATLADDLRFSSLLAPNPHLVAFMRHVDDVRLAEVAQAANRLPAFPDGVNTSFVMPSDDDGRDFYVRTYERGAGSTPSCASGAVAAAATLVRLGHAPTSERLQIRNNGGPLQVTIDSRDDGLYATQSGNATYVYKVEATLSEILEKTFSDGSIVETYADETLASDSLWDKNAVHLRSLGAASNLTDSPPALGPSQLTNA